MRAIAAIPVKRFGAAKQRLRAALPEDSVPALASAMLTDVLAAVCRCKRIERLIVVSGEPGARRLASAARAELLDDPDDAGHSAAALLAARRAEDAGAPLLALLPGDCPLLDPAELDAALARCGGAEREAAVVPDRHGEGTNALLLSPPGAIAPAFGPGSRRRHLELAQAAGAVGRVERLDSLALDLDTPDDLAELAALLEREPERAPATAAALAPLAGRAAAG